VKRTQNAPLSRLCYWRVGGHADQLVDVETLAELQQVVSEGPVTVLGRGSNTLVHDEGIRGCVIRLKGALADIDLETGVAGAGLWLNVLIRRLERAGLCGAEPFLGVPGTVGGAVVMNAGTTLGEACDVVEEVTVVLPDGSLRALTVAECGFAYRHSALPPGSVVASARFRLGPDTFHDRRHAFLARRKASQPLSKPSCGSTFTNPPGDHAGRLIEAAGLKGFTIGGAQVSEKHANFFLNTGSASAADIAALIRHARTVVHDQFGVWLRPEVKLMGPWEPGALGPQSLP
jgi:UDP-N-acetylmuramate dehydrogenase